MARPVGRASEHERSRGSPCSENDGAIRDLPWPDSVGLSLLGQDAAIGGGRLWCAPATTRNRSLGLGWIFVRARLEVWGAEASARPWAQVLGVGDILRSRDVREDRATVGGLHGFIGVPHQTRQVLIRAGRCGGSAVLPPVSRNASPSRSLPGATGSRSARLLPMRSIDFLWKRSRQRSTFSQQAYFYEPVTGRRSWIWVEENVTTPAEVRAIAWRSKARR